MRGEEVCFVCGTDEYGVAVTMNADREGVPYWEYVARWRDEAKGTFDRLGIEFDQWSGTSISPHHAELAQKFFRRLDVKIVGQVTHLGDTPHVADLIGTIKIMLDSYADGTIDRLYMAHNIFVNTMSQKPEMRELLPVETIDKDELQEHWDYIYEPAAADLLDGVLMRYIESQVYRAAVENVSCEMAARMVAMKSASDNAGTLIDELQLIYNKARQAAITQEITEIVGGAAAV
jgi:F-type H+-transporting ATPase subunit gamma